MCAHPPLRCFISQLHGCFLAVSQGVSGTDQRPVREGVDGGGEMVDLLGTINIKSLLKVAVEDMKGVAAEQNDFSGFVKNGCWWCGRERGERR